VLRAAGMDALLGFPKDRTAEFISKRGLPSEKVGQLIETIGQVIHAKPEVGQAMEAVATAGVPGFPRNPSHSDEQVLGLLRHMDIKPGEGPVLRAAGMDALLGFPQDRTAEFISKRGLPSEKVGQLIETIGQVKRAKDGRGQLTSRYLTEDQAMTETGPESIPPRPPGGPGRAAGEAWTCGSAPGVWMRQTGCQRPQTRKGPADQTPAPERALSRADGSHYFFFSPPVLTRSFSVVLGCLSA